ncbi:hypothetical protein GW17_00030234 [Ensete ventricosum]|nr:hypothetical protein GW17_00030234 [Ensete ventricosum]
MMQLETRLECVESLLRLSGACQDGVREFVRRRPRLTGRLSGIAQKLLGSSKRSWTAQADGCTTHTLFSGWLSAVASLASMVVPPVPGFFGCV